MLYEDVDEARAPAPDRDSPEDIRFNRAKIGIHKGCGNHLGVAEVKPPEHGPDFGQIILQEPAQGRAMPQELAPGQVVDVGDNTFLLGAHALSVRQESCQARVFLNVALRLRKRRLCRLPLDRLRSIVRIRTSACGLRRPLISLR